MSGPAPAGRIRRGLRHLGDGGLAVAAGLQLLGAGGLVAGVALALDLALGGEVLPWGLQLLACLTLAGMSLTVIAFASSSAGRPAVLGPPREPRPCPRCGQSGGTFTKLAPGLYVWEPGTAEERVP